jgi:hypothetical protein
MVPVAPVITGINFAVTFHMCLISIMRSLCFKISSASSSYYYYYIFNALQVIMREKLIQDPIQMKLLTCSWLNGVRKIAVLQLNFLDVQCQAKVFLNHAICS